MKHTILTLTACSLLAIPCAAFEGPTMGWSSWNTYRVNISEKLIKSQADAMVVTGLQDAGYQYINIDDGYLGGRDADGNLITNHNKFPNGLKPVVDYIHSRGLKAGIYSDAGRNTCGSYYDNDKHGIGVGLYGHDDTDADFFFRKMGFDFIKIDFCGGDAKQNSERLALNEKDRYTAIYRAIRNIGRDDVRINICRWNYPGTWAHDIAASWRISQDINNSWSSIQNIIGQNLYLSAYAYNGSYNDMDMLEVGRGLSEEEDKTHFGMWCIMSSPLLIGCDLTQINPTTLELIKNKELIAINQDRLGVQAYVAKKISGVYILVKDIIERNANQRVVGLYNPTDSEQTVSLNFEDIELGGKIKVRDLYERKNLGSFRKTMEVNIPPHATRIYKLNAKKRLERTIYEGETGYISNYQEIANNRVFVSGIYENDSICSGQAKATWLGNSESNDLLWREVFSQKGGEYELTICYIAGEERSMNISVNNKPIDKITVNTHDWKKTGTTKIKISLNKGNNIIRLHNSSNWMPDIDYISLKKIK